jgi:5,10-methylenetetrahydromethanopterin reductase
MSISPVFHLGFPAPSVGTVRTHQWAELARLAEDLGFDVLWHSNERFYREMFVRMTVSTLATDRLGIGGAVADPFSVHPAITAQSVATLQELSGGRASLALGAGGSGFPMMGIQRVRPALALREAYEVIRGLVAGDTVTLEGEVVTARAAHLHFVPQQSPPIWIATRGDRALGTAGAVADGVIVATYATTPGIRAALDLVEEGAVTAGRRMASIRIMARVDTCVHPDRDQAFAGSRLMVARLLWSSYPDRNFVTRLGLKVPASIEKVIALRDYDAMRDVQEQIPDEFVSEFCWSGTPDEVAERVRGIARDTGIREFGFWVLRAPGQSLEDAATLVANDVVSAVRSAVGRADGTV